MCSCGARAHVRVPALYQANEYRANATEVIMWGIIALRFLPHPGAAFGVCHC